MIWYLLGFRVIDLQKHLELKTDIFFPLHFQFMWSLKDVGDMPEPSNIHVQFPELPQNVHKIDAAFQNKISSTLVLTSGK